MDRWPCWRGVPVTLSQVKQWLIPKRVSWEMGKGSMGGAVPPMVLNLWRRKRLTWIPVAVPPVPLKRCKLCMGQGDSGDMLCPACRSLGRDMTSLEMEGPDGRQDSGSGRAKTFCGVATDTDLSGVRGIFLSRLPMLVIMIVPSGGQSSLVLEGPRSYEEPGSVVPTEHSLELPNVSMFSWHAYGN